MSTGLMHSWSIQKYGAAGIHPVLQQLSPQLHCPACQSAISVVRQPLLYASVAPGHCMFQSGMTVCSTMITTSHRWDQGKREARRTYSLVLQQSGARCCVTLDAVYPSNRVVSRPPSLILITSFRSIVARDYASHWRSLLSYRHGTDLS
jgi:hypothetical protein